MVKIRRTAQPDYIFVALVAAVPLGFAFGGVLPGLLAVLVLEGYLALDPR